MRGVDLSASLACCFLLLLREVASEDLFPPKLANPADRRGKPFFLFRKLGLVQQAAEYALDVYSSTTSVAVKKGEEESAVLVEKDDTNNICYFAFRGRTEGFHWVADINLKAAYIQSRDDQSKRCRVVRHYKKLYSQQRGYEGTDYKTSIASEVTDCIANNAEIVFTGHDIGGALAVMYGVAFEAYGKLRVYTFGQPPVFMPRQYGMGLLEANGELKSKAAAKQPCIYLTPNYVSFLNTEKHPTRNVLAYDFMYWLNIVLYTMANDPDYRENEVPASLGCMQMAADKVDEFMGAGRTGNVGSQYGTRIMFEPTEVDFVAANVSADEQDQFLTGVPPIGRLIVTGGPGAKVFSAYAFPQGVARNWTETGRSTEFFPLPESCDFGTDNPNSKLHDMATYVENINRVEAPGPGMGENSLLTGFRAGRFCNFGNECDSGSCLAGFVCACGSCRAQNEAMMKGGREKTMRNKKKKQSRDYYAEEVEVDVGGGWQ